jgi:hypothetical protein
LFSADDGSELSKDRPKLFARRHLLRRRLTEACAAALCWAAGRPTWWRTMPKSTLKLGAGTSPSTATSRKCLMAGSHTCLPRRSRLKESPLMSRGWGLYARFSVSRGTMFKENYRCRSPFTRALGPGLRFRDAGSAPSGICGSCQVVVGILSGIYLALEPSEIGRGDDAT